MAAYQIGDRSMSTILAALRYYQRSLAAMERREAGSLYIPVEIQEIASNGGAYEPHTAADIEEMCQLFNLGDHEAMAG